MKYIVLGVILLCSVPNLMAQASTELKKQADKAFINKKYREAAVLYGNYQLDKPGNVEVIANLGTCNYMLQNTEKAKQYFEYLLSSNAEKAPIDAYYYYARTLHSNMEWDKAVAMYKTYLGRANGKHAWRGNAIDQIKRCASGVLARTNDHIALVENLGNQVNTIYDDFAPVPSVNHSNRLYFASNRTDATGGLRNEEGIEDEMAGSICSDMFFADRSNAGWKAAESLGSLLNTARHEQILGFNSTGKVLYFFRGFTQYAGDVMIDTAGASDEHSLRDNTLFSPMFPEKGDVSPFFYNDTTLIFASHREGGFGGLDLYITIRSNGIWNTPENLGNEINGPYDENMAFLAKNGNTLFFSSNRTESIGGYDIYRANYDVNLRHWKVESMGMPVNSPEDDTHFVLLPDGKTAYFASNRAGTLGERDLYVAYYKKEAEEQAGTKKIYPVFASGASMLIAPENIETVAASTTQIVAQPLFYEDDKDVLSTTNMKALGDLADFARANPEKTVLVTAHSDDSGQNKFDLYFCIKRAEMIGAALEKKGIAPARIKLLSCGSNYPMAMNMLGKDVNPSGQRLNKRIEVQILSLDGRGPHLKQVFPEVPEVMKSKAADTYRNEMEGLAYKVEVVTTRQIFNSEVIDMFTHVMIESTQGAGEYRYTVGLHKTYEQALAEVNELKEQGFESPRILAYINGVYISPSEAAPFKKKYPALAQYK